MKLQHYTNNAYDSLVLRSDAGDIVGAWSNADQSVIAEYYGTVGGDPSLWESNQDDWRPQSGMDRLVSTINTDGSIETDDVNLSRARMAFWGIK